METIRPFEDPEDGDQLIATWRGVFDYYASPHNHPRLSLDKKLAVKDGLLFVAETDGKVVGSILAGYDGHRGWIYSLAVLPEYRHRGIGTRLVRHAEAHLQHLGWAPASRPARTISSAGIVS